ncbi:MAG: hypothetical protein HQ514_14605 [Rhodospirillales bacterium]|nr:hypothetical protein [Rhodospirillales bacterium]
MKGNPEFIRNLWLEARPARLIMMAALLGALFLLVGLRSGLGDTLANTALTAYVAIIFIWGNRLAANSVIQEVNNGTWDSQRMSAISPWKMAVGKLYGGTIYVWFGGLICLGVYWLAQSRGGYSPRLLQTTIIYLGCGLLSHIISLIVSLVAIRKRRAYGRLRVWLYQFIGLAAAAPILFLGTNVVDRSKWGIGSLTEMSWYGMPFQQFGFTASAIAIFVVWGIVGAYRMMRVELLSRNGPFLWLGFTVFTAIFVAGIHMTGNWARLFRVFSLFENSIAYLMNMGSIIILLLAYVIALAEPKDKSVFIMLRRYAGERRWRDFFDVLPRSASTLALALLMIAATGARGLFDADQFGAGKRNAQIAMIFLFAARDIGFITLMSLWRPSPRADMTALVCLALSYSLVPALFFASGIYALRPLFQPVFSGDPYLNLALIGIETVTVYLILAFTIRSVVKPETA